MGTTGTEFHSATESRLLCRTPRFPVCHQNTDAGTAHVRVTAALRGTAPTTQGGTGWMAPSPSLQGPWAGSRCHSVGA